MLIVRASSHQGHPKVLGNGRQCVAISAMAMQLSKTLPPRKWDPYKLDKILQDNDSFYMALNRKNLQL